jgi:hypothetical protein
MLRKWKRGERQEDDTVGRRRRQGGRRPWKKVAVSRQVGGRHQLARGVIEDLVRTGTDEIRQGDSESEVVDGCCDRAWRLKKRKVIENMPRKLSSRLLVSL